MKIRYLLSAFALALVAASSATAGADETAPVLLASGRIDEAITALHGQINSSPNDAVAQNLLCRAYLTLRQWDRGISACEKAVAIEPGNGEYHLWLGRIYGGKADDSGPFTAARLAGHVRTEFETAVKLLPNSVDAHSDLAEFYLEAPGIVGGGRDKAIQQANSLAQLDAARAHWVNARIAEKKKDLRTAEAEYRAAIDTSNGSASGWLNLGLFYRHRERYNEMEQALIHVRPAPLDRPDALVDAADILIHSQRNLQEAAELLRAYLNSNKKVEQAPAFKAHYLLGTACEKLGDKRAAMAEYKSALTLAREFQPAQQALQRMNR
jgi:tetratricopeptide (TPR) repeat protein